MHCHRYEFRIENKTRSRGRVCIQVFVRHIYKLFTSILFLCPASRLPDGTKISGAPSNSKDAKGVNEQLSLLHNHKTCSTTNEQKQQWGNIADYTIYKTDCIQSIQAFLCICSFTFILGFMMFRESIYLLNMEENEGKETKQHFII